MRHFSRRVTMLAVPAVLALGAGSALAATSDGADLAAAGPAAQSGIFLKLDGIPGESTDSQHPGEIDVTSFDVGVKNTGGGAAGGGGGAGKATFSPVTFTKLYDKSSPLLLKATASGQHIRSAEFTFRRPGPNGSGFLVEKLEDVTVTDYEQGGDTGTDPLLEHVSLSYAKISVAYTPVAGPPLVTAGWDLLANVSV
jgi:type VI secretion system secreted protein Hcp